MIDGTTFTGYKIVSKSSQSIDREELKDCIGQPVLRMQCRGKRFFLRLTEDVCLTFHHMMGGSWTLEKTKHTQIRLKFNDDVKIYYNALRFGGVSLILTEAKFSKTFNAIAPGFIGDDVLTKQQFVKRCKSFSKRKVVRYALTDQKVLCSGIGNYLVAEIMYYTMIHPQATFGDLDQEQLEGLYDMCLEVVTGFYNQELDKVVYMFTRDPFDNEVIQTKMGDGRTAHWVAEVQTIGAPET
jgi:formamidopyrimidine-DNA glycosylase